MEESNVASEKKNRRWKWVNRRARKKRGNYRQPSRHIDRPNSPNRLIRCSLFPLLGRRYRDCRTVTPCMCLPTFLRLSLHRSRAVGCIMNHPHSIELEGEQNGIRPLQRVLSSGPDVIRVIYNRSRK